MAVALTLMRRVRAAGFTVTAAVGDAEFGDNATLRRTLHRAKLPYALGVSSDLKVFLGTPALEAPPPLLGTGRPRTRRHLPTGTQTIEARVWAAAQPAGAWRLVSWRNGTNPAWRARFCAVRVTPAHDWRESSLARSLVAVRTGAGRWGSRALLPGALAGHGFAPHPRTTGLPRWAIEQQYQELKDEPGARSLRRAQPA